MNRPLAARRLLLPALLAVLCGAAMAAPPPALMQRGSMPAATQAQPELDGAAIIARAHRAAGADFIRPSSLFLEGYNIIRSADGAERLWHRYAMWRVFGEQKQAAHSASGRVRIEAWTDDTLALLLAFDGERSYDRNGVMADQSANAMWSNNFGFGAIRNALDPGWSQQRRPDDLIDGEPAFMVELTDPSGGTTLFGIRQRDDAIVYVGFATPRGWHERRYSHFFSKPGVDWVQAGRVRLYYDGVKANEAIWTDFRINEAYPISLFQPDGELLAPSW